MDFLYSVIAFIVALGVLVTVHEFGHFWVARRLGIKVLTFSVGFGRALWSRRSGKDETEFVVAMIPLGGYVRMLDESEGEVAAHERHRAFNRQSLSKRVAVVVAGPAFNFLFAIVAYWCMYMIGVEGLRPIVDEVVPGSVASRAGFHPGDEVRAVRDNDVGTWQSAVQAIISASLDEDAIGIEVVDDSGRRRERVVDPGALVPDDLTHGRFFEHFGLAPARPDLPAVIGGVESGGPAQRDGLRAGDRVVRAAGESIDGWSQWVRIVRGHPGRMFAVDVERDGATIEIRLTPDVEETADGTRFGRIGAAAHAPEMLVERFYVTERYGPWSALARGVGKTVEISGLTLRMMWKMVRMEVSLENLSGPIGIAEYAGAPRGSDWRDFSSFWGSSA